MGIVIQMRIIKPFISLLFVTLIAVSAPGMANAASVVDQYTEQIPGPGGSEISKPGDQNPTGNAPAPGQSGGGVNGGDTDTSVGADPTSAGASGIPGDSSSDTDGALQGTGQSDSSQGSTAVGIEGSDSTATSSSSDAGMGWLFPAGMVLVAIAILTFVVTRHHRRTSSV